MLENGTTDIVAGRFDAVVRKLEFMSETLGGHRRLLSGAATLSSEPFFGEICLAAVVGEGLAGVGGDEVR